MIGRVRAGCGRTYSANRGGVAGLMGELCDQYPVPRHECACASRGAAVSCPPAMPSLSQVAAMSCWASDTTDAIAPWSVE